jgi:hypothetical protein
MGLICGDVEIKTTSQVKLENKMLNAGKREVKEDVGKVKNEVKADKEEVKKKLGRPKKSKDESEFEGAL